MQLVQFEFLPRLRHPLLVSFPPPPPPPLLLFNPTLIHPFSFFWDLALWVALSSWDVPLTTILGFHLSFSWLGFPVLCLTSSSFLACLLQMFHPTEKIAQWQRARFPGNTSFTSVTSWDKLVVSRGLKHLPKCQSPNPYLSSQLPLDP